MLQLVPRDESSPLRVTSFLGAVSLVCFFSLLLSYPFCAKVYFLYINSNLSGIVTGFQFLTGSGRSVMWGWATQGKSLTVALDLESSVNPRWSCSLGPVCPKGAESGSSQEGSPMNLERGHQ